ncbi:MAG TPA: DUF5985 family protein [Thermoanaerobaculia bacterium]
MLLYRGYRRSHTRLLFWSAVCFVGLAANNVLLIVDLRVVPAIDLSAAKRSTIAYINTYMAMNDSAVITSSRP